MQFSQTWQNRIFFLHLVSTSSLASKSPNRELAKALDAKIKIIPIILESCDWLYHPLSNYQALPEHGKPINEWVPESKGWQNVVDGIRHVAGEMRDSISDGARKGILFEWVLQQGNFPDDVGADRKGNRSVLTCDRTESRFCGGLCMSRCMLTTKKENMTIL